MTIWPAAHPEAVPDGPRRSWRALAVRAAVQDPSADRCLALQVAAAFSVQQALSRSAEEPDRQDDTDPSDRTTPASRPADQGTSCGGRSSPPGPRGHLCLNIPVDPDIAVLLTSDMVTNSIVRGDGKTITLAIRCSFGHLRIDVYDASRSLPTAVDGSAVTKTGSWLVLVAALSTEWGSFLTPAGQVVYFTLAFQSDVPSGGELAAAGDRHGDCEPWTRLAVPTSRTSWERHQPVTGVT